MCEKKEKDTTTDKYISRKEIRKGFYKCRDFELANLWQRSIFLSAFLILCFTGYGYILVKIIEIISSNNANKDSLPYLHLVAIGIGVLNFLFSILWIMMGKGSKAWYEIYETAICDIDKEIIEDGDDKYRMGNLALDKTKPFDNKLLSRNAGPFSVSKINIGIGQLCLWLWGIIIVFHSILNIKFLWTPITECICKCGNNTNNCCEERVCLSILNIILIIAVPTLVYVFKDKFKSGYNFFNDN